MSEHNRMDAFVTVDSDENEVRDLLASAGPRPAVPPEELAKLEAVARQRWLEMVESERERARFGRRAALLALAASLLIAVALRWWMMPDRGGVSAARVARVELVRGQVSVDDTPAATGRDLLAGTTLSTGGEGSGAAVRLAQAQSVRLDVGTRVRLISASRLELEHGAVYVDTHGAARGDGVEISTSFGVVHEIGTQFLVRVDEQGAGELTVQVRAGEVVLEAEPGSKAARAGEKLTLRRGSNLVETFTVDRHGPSWDWIEKVTPAMNIDGAPLSDYLEWVSRETGRGLRYADGGLAKTARSIRLSGSIEGLTPEESLAILPGSGLDHRIENGWLMIEHPRE